MSVYSKKGKGWRYDFMLNGQRYTEAWFKTKKAAKGKAEDSDKPRKGKLKKKKGPREDRPKLRRKR